MNRPLWLQSAEIQALLNRLLDRVDRAQKQGTDVRSIKLDAKIFPPLHRAHTESDKARLWGYVKEMQAWGFFVIKTDKGSSSDAPYNLNPRVKLTDVASLREAAGRLQRILSPQELWRCAVSSHLEAPEQVKADIGRMRPIEISGYSADEVVKRLNILRGLKDDARLLREISAHVFWGLSKVLDSRQQLVARVLETEQCPFPQAPIQLNVFLPSAAFRGVLFIENKTTFEKATWNSEAQFAGLALVDASGFKSSAERIRQPRGASVYIASHGIQDADTTAYFLQWLQGERELPSWFWGDLDVAGMEILASMRKQFPDMRAWEPGYSMMLNVIDEGHLPDSAGKEQLRAAMNTGCAFADTVLIPAMRETGRYVDQERF